MNRQIPEDINLMHAVFDSITSRDMALMFWLVVACLWGYRNPEIRRSFGSVLRVASQRTLMVSFILAALTTIVLCLCLSWLGLWGAAQLKGSIFWFVVACIPSMSDIPELSKDFGLFRQAALKNFKFSILVDFYLNMFHAPFLVELILLPIATCLTLAQVVAERDEKLQPAVSVITAMLATLGTVCVAFQTYKLYTSFVDIQNLDTIRDFLLPIILNLMFLPMLALYAAYAAYESVFCRLHFYITDPKLCKDARRILIIRCGLNYMRLNRWASHKRFGSLSSREEILLSIRSA